MSSTPIENLKLEPGTTKLLTGKDFRVLEDKSVKTFQTSDPMSFLKFVKDFSESSHVLTYNENEMILTRKDGSHYDKNIARCNFEFSDLYNHVNEQLDSSLAIEEFIKWMSKMKKNLDDVGLDLLFNAKDLKIAKITQIQRTRDNKGNYIFNISRESKKDSGEYEPPDTYHTTVPVFNYVDIEENLIKIPLELEFDYQEHGGSVSIYLETSCPTINEIVMYQQKLIVEALLEQLPFKSYFGNLQNVTQHDGWKYQESGQR